MNIIYVIIKMPASKRALKLGNSLWSEDFNDIGMEDSYRRKVMGVIKCF